MSDNLKSQDICVVVGASHAGVNFAFALRQDGWDGQIIMYDADPELPYHRPPLSKTYLTDDRGMSATPLKSKESYERDNIKLHLNTKIASIDVTAKELKLSDGSVQTYDKLVLATGARPIMPPIPGFDTAKNVFRLRTAADVEGIRKALGKNPKKKVVVIGGGYIGLEIAASLKKLGSDVTILEREERILARVTAPEISYFFHELHVKNGVEVLTGKNISSLEIDNDYHKIVCSDGLSYPADIIIIGVGILVNTELAEKAGLTIQNGIKVDSTAKASNESIYAIGDCTFHHNPHYDRFVRLESVQNAVDQAKVAAAAICGKEVVYNAIPWFWSDQYNIKLQIVGLSNGYDNIVIRTEEKEQPCFSIWYFNGDRLLSVDAINNSRAYVVATKFIKSNQRLDKLKLANSSIELKPNNFMEV
ncbi:pyridine nucleotide-disulfide oxidoreductase [Maribacter algicola]|uniref:Pyridine nucleotide-disulfide oxidoreductase n=1 Tax=Maribacter algicola TaxID=2498892 RepID=A0A3R8Q2W9_9FLAO|nr:FAD-dependent oxidoreductase [Maribacter algicola]RRQ48606.1 pyridine nucleotide-disulfide oxidoreductase [Maribacter algicola]